MCDGRKQGLSLKMSDAREFTMMSRRENGLTIIVEFRLKISKKKRGYNNMSVENRTNSSPLDALFLSKEQMELIKPRSKSSPDPKQKARRTQKEEKLPGNVKCEVCARKCRRGHDFTLKHSDKFICCRCSFRWGFTQDGSIRRLPDE